MWLDLNFWPAKCGAEGFNTSTSIDEDFGIQNKEHLESELQAEIIPSESYESLPEIHVTVKHDPTLNEEMEEVTPFRAINVKEDTNMRTSRKSKFELWSTYSRDTDTE